MLRQYLRDCCQRLVVKQSKVMNSKDLAQTRLKTYIAGFDMDLQFEECHIRVAVSSSRECMGNGNEGLTYLYFYFSLD